jgi:hypothetical protein
LALSGMVSYVELSAFQAAFVVMEQAAFLIGESGGICVRARAGRSRGVITSVAVSTVWIQGTCAGILTSVLAFGIAGRRDIEEMSHAFQLDLTVCINLFDFRHPGSEFCDLRYLHFASQDA